jgi:hypothetical protein
MPVKKKRAGSKPEKREGSSTALYFSLGAIAAAITAALVTLLRRRSLMASPAEPGMEPPRKAKAELAPSPVLAEKSPQPESAAPHSQMIQSPPAHGKPGATAWRRSQTSPPP